MYPFQHTLTIISTSVHDVENFKSPCTAKQVMCITNTKVSLVRLEVDFYRFFFFLCFSYTTPDSKRHEKQLL